MVDSEKGSTVPQTTPRFETMGAADVAPMIAQHAVVRELCLALEAWANGLPDPSAILGAASVSGTLADTLRRHEAAENATLAKLIVSGGNAANQTAFSRLCQRQAVDQLHAEDLHDALDLAVLVGVAATPDTLSYMMRCLFDGCRRAIDFREATILLLAHERLTPAARHAIRHSLFGGV